MQTGDYNNAIKLLLSALDNFYKTGEEQNISDCLDSIGEFYLRYREYPRALEYFLKSMKIVENINDRYRLFSLYANVARTYIAMDEKENALMYFGKTLELANAVGDKSRLSEILVIISEYFTKNKDYKNTYTYLNRALNIAREIGDTVSIALSVEALAEVYYDTNEIEKALKFALDAQSIAEEKNIKELLQKSSLLLSGIYAVKKDYKAAVENYIKYSETKDSLISSEKIKIIEETRVKYNFEKLENEKLSAENKALVSENKIFNRNIFIIILSGFLIIIGCFFIRYLFRRKKEALEQKSRQTSLIKKIDLLTSQLDSKNRELTSKAMMISQNNKVLEEISTTIDHYLNGGVDERNELRKLKNLLESTYQEKSWDDFLKHFEEVHPNFYRNLTKKFPDLTSGEQKICAFLRMNLNTKEISQITNQTIKSIEVARTRIRKKLSIDHNENLYSIVQNI
jgi:tetratricopeptide (TPR) repeat protein